MNKTKIQATVVADSISSNGNRITTMLITMPRIILAEFNTHRMFSRNTSSSRAIPFEKMVKVIEDDPFIPIAWQKSHKGMQGNEYITEKNLIDFKTGTWLHARNWAVRCAKDLHSNINYITSSNDDVHEIEGTSVTKQLCNRLLEPYMWTTVLVTATEWNNFFELRCPQYKFGTSSYRPKSKKEWLRTHNELYGRHPDEGGIYFKEPTSDIEWYAINEGQSEIHMMELAECRWDAYKESKPVQRTLHVPFRDMIDTSKCLYGLDTFLLIQSTAICARTSYTINSNNVELDQIKNRNLHDMLLESKHLSPFEHCAFAKPDSDFHKNFKGWVQYRELVEQKIK